MLHDEARSWEVIPNVIRNYGVEALRVEIDVNGPVADVRFDGNFTNVLIHADPVVFNDDGLVEDRIVGDFVYTAGPFRYNTNLSLPSFYLGDAESLAIFSPSAQKLVFNSAGQPPSLTFGHFQSTVKILRTPGLHQH